MSNQTRGIIGWKDHNPNVIQFIITIQSTLGDAQDFGDRLNPDLQKEIVSQQQEVSLQVDFVLLVTYNSIDYVTMAINGRTI